MGQHTTTGLAGQECPDCGKDRCSCNWGGGMSTDQPLIFTRAIGLSGQPRIDLTLSGGVAQALAREALAHLTANPTAAARIYVGASGNRLDREAAVAALMDLFLQLRVELDAIEAEDLALALRDQCGPASEHELAHLEEAS